MDKRFARYGWLGKASALALVLGLPLSAYAQVGPTTPSGSPLDPTNGSSTEEANTASPNTVDRNDAAAIEANPFVRSQAPSPFSVPSQNAGSNVPLAQARLIDARDGILTRAPPTPGEFEQYVGRVLGRRLPRFGENLILPAQRDFAAPATATVPPSYIVQPGDIVVVSITGSIEASVEREVDTNGKIFLAGVGEIKVAGVRHADLRDVVSAAIGRQFRGYTVSVSIARLRGIRVFVTGLATNPGAFTVSSLSTLANAAFQAGGPASGGSWRSIKLYRNGRQVADFDLYELMRGGSRVNDVALQNEDVLFIPPAGEQVAIIGSVQQEAIYEAKPGESVADMLAAAGGPSTLADRSRVIVYRAGDIDVVGPRQVAIAQAAAEPVRGGDILQMVSQGSLTMPIDRQSVLVRIEGEVNRPGIYYVSPNTPTSEIIAQAGGLSSTAYAFGTRFVRQSVRIQQAESFREAIRQLDISLAAAPIEANSTISAADRAAQIAGARAVVDRLRQTEPDGRLVLSIAPDATTLPANIVLENNDTIYVPPRATTVGVFGAIYRPASFLLNRGDERMRVRDYVERAGGTLRSADRRNTFVVRANGEVLSRKRGALNALVLPGDVVFVPVKTQGSSFWARLRDITQIVFQLGLSAAAVAAIAE